MTQVNYLITFMLWNGYPHSIRTKTIKLLRQKRQQKNDDQDKENLPVMCWIKTHQYLIILQSVTFTSIPLLT